MQETTISHRFTDFFSLINESVAKINFCVSPKLFMPLGKYQVAFQTHSTHFSHNLSHSVHVHGHSLIIVNASIRKINQIFNHQ